MANEYIFQTKFLHEMSTIQRVQSNDITIIDRAICIPSTCVLVHYTVLTFTEAMNSISGQSNDSTVIDRASAFLVLVC